MSNRDIGGGKAEAIVQLSVSELLASIREMMREVLREGKFHGMEIDRVSLRTDKVALWGVGEVAGNPPSKDQ